MAQRRPLVRKNGQNQELATGDTLPSSLLQVAGVPFDVVPWQAVALQSAVLIDGVTALLTGNQFAYQASWATGRQVVLEIIGGASLAGGGCVATLLAPDNSVAATVTATSTLASGLTVARSQPLTLVDSTVYRPGFRATAASNGITLNLTASLRLMRLLFL